MTKRPALRARVVTKTFGEQHALVGVDVVSDRWEVAALIAPSGSGRSTLLRGLTQLTHFEARGQLDVFGESFADIGKRWASTRTMRTQLGFVARNDRLVDRLSPFNSVAVGGLGTLSLSRGLPGPGPLAHTAGVFGKLLSAAVRRIDLRQVEGIYETEAHPLAQVVQGKAPQMGPLRISYGHDRDEASLRSATVRVLIGAGGIGQAQFEAIGRFAYRETPAMALVTSVVFAAIYLVSDRLGRHFL